MLVFNAVWMSCLGVAAIAYGLLKKKIQFRDGREIRAGWPSGLARTWFVALGVLLLVLAMRQFD
jgi:hypothetical protein